MSIGLKIPLPAKNFFYRWRFLRSFTLIELLAVVAVIGIIAAILLPVLSRTRATSQAISCRNNLKQWGTAMHLYAADHYDFLPPEGVANPQDDLGQLNATNLAWYIQLPEEMNLTPYAAMPWRTNPFIDPGNSIWICPANSRRCDSSSKTNNLFHYCLNEYINGTGSNNIPMRISAIRQSSAVIWMFDSKNLPAVGTENYVHTNLHNSGAQFVFLDGHVARFKNTAYWNFKTKKAITNNPELVWFP